MSRPATTTAEIQGGGVDVVRVGQFLAHYPSRGGTTTVLRGLASGLIELGHDVVIYGYGESDQPPLDGAHERIFRAPRLGQPGIAAVSRPDELRRALQTNEDDLDVLIIHGMFSPFSMGISRAARAGGIKTIAQPHDPYSPAVFHERRLAKVIYWRLFERHFLCSVDAIQLYAPSQREHLARRGVDTKTFSVPAGIPLRLLRRAADTRRRVMRTDEHALRLLFVGRFDVYNKGLDLLLEAIATTPALRSRILLECIGARSDVEYAAATEITQRLGLTGCVSLSYRSEDPWPAFEQADLFILPSRFDGFALVVLEALAAGTPVVVSSAAGAAEHVGGDKAVVVAQPSVEGLRHALLDATARLTELRAGAVDAHRRIGRQLTWPLCAERWLACVRELRLVPPQTPVKVER